MTDSPYELRFSQAAYWVKCAAYSTFNKRTEHGIVATRGDNTVREEGTAIHWAAEQLMLGINASGSKASNGVLITDELQDVAAFYVSVLDGYKGVDWNIETQIAAPRIHPKCGGTPDAFGYRQDVRRILVGDCKGGFENVEVFPNWQLFCGLAGVLDNNPSWELDNTVVEFFIVQPRSHHKDGPYRAHTMRLQDCYPYIAELSRAAHAAMGESASATAGRQCDRCSARATCTVSLRAGQRALEISGEPDLLDVTPASVDYELLRISEAMRALEARKTALEAHAESFIRSGRILPNFEMAPGRGRREWIDENEAILMGDLFSVNLRKPVVPITPVQAMSKLPKEIVESYSRSTPAALKLTRYNASATAKAFSKVEKL